MDPTAIESLAKAATDATAKALAIIEQAEAEKRSLTDDESEEVQGHYKEAERLGNEIETRRKAHAVASRISDIVAEPVGRKTEDLQPSETPAQLAKNKKPNAADDTEEKPGWKVGQNRLALNPKGGFLSFGDFVKDVVVAGKNKATGFVPPKLQALASATTYGSTSSGADGGFAIPQDFTSSIMNAVMGEESLIARCLQYRLTGNSLRIPTDETTPWGTSGVQVYPIAEGAAVTQSKPALNEIELKLKKIAALVPLTEELLEDSPGLESHVMAKVPDAFTSKLNYYVIQGTGSGQPLGVFNAGCKVSVAKNADQVADTVIANNIYSMWARMPSKNRRDAVWVMHPSVEASLHLMTSIVYSGTTPVVGGTPLYQPPGFMASAPNGTLLGKPIFITEACETLGDNGDLWLFDPSSYAVALKGAGVRQTQSPHLWFDQQIMALMFTLRIDGQPTWSTTVSPRDGSATYSPFITLDERT